MDIHNTYRPMRLTNRGRTVVGAVAFAGLWELAKVLPFWMRWFV